MCTNVASICHQWWHVYSRHKKCYIYKWRTETKSTNTDHQLWLTSAYSMSSNFWSVHPLLSLSVNVRTNYNSTISCCYLNIRRIVNIIPIRCILSITIWINFLPGDTPYKKYIEKDRPSRGGGVLNAVKDTTPVSIVPSNQSNTSPEILSDWIFASLLSSAVFTFLPAQVTTTWMMQLLTWHKSSNQIYLQTRWRQLTCYSLGHTLLYFILIK